MDCFVDCRPDGVQWGWLDVWAGGGYANTINAACGRMVGPAGNPITRENGRFHCGERIRERQRYVTGKLTGRRKAAALQDRNNEQVFLSGVLRTFFQRPFIQKSAAQREENAMSSCGNTGRGLVFFAFGRFYRVLF